MFQRAIPVLLLTLVLLAGCSTAASDHDGARLPAARPESITAQSGATIHPGQISQELQVDLHTDGRVTVHEAFAGTQHFKDWMNERYDMMKEAMGGDLERQEVGDQLRFHRQVEFKSIAELNDSGMMQVERFGSPFIYSLKWQTSTSSYSAAELAQLFTQPAEQVADADWGAYLLDAYHLRYQVNDERTGQQYSWERSAREIGSGQTVSFVDKAWRPLAWVLLGLAGVVLAFVTWAGFFGERVWAPRAEPS